MSNPPASAPSPTIRQSLGLDRHPLTGLKAVALVAAILMMVGGAVIAFTVDRPETPAATAASRSASTPSGGGLLGNSFGESRPGGAPASAGTPSATAEPANEDALGLHDLSPFMLKGGFGLFIGFAMGFAVRAFLRLALVIVGFYCLLLTMMAYLGWVEVHWNLMEDQFTRFTTLLSSQLQSFRAFLTGAIPALGMTAGGFFVGLRRR